MWGKKVLKREIRQFRRRVSIQCKLTISHNYFIPLHVVGMRVVILQLWSIPYRHLKYKPNQACQWCTLHVWQFHCGGHKYIIITLHNCPPCTFSNAQVITCPNVYLLHSLVDCREGMNINSMIYYIYNTYNLTWDSGAPKK
jgi:hypothetical protein